MKVAIDSDRFARVFDASNGLGTDFNARGTPHFFVNGYRSSDAPPYERFKEVVDQQLTRADALVQVIAGKHRLLELLGKGGMGSVWRAGPVELGIMSVAVKLMLPEFAAHPEALARFKREAEALTLLRSPHLVPVCDFGVDAGTPYIVMELLRGGGVLSDRLARVGRLSLGETAALLAQVARGVGKAHDAGIVHRGLKPANLYLEPDDDREVVKVFDFGIAKRMDGFGLSTIGLRTQSGAVPGTPFYMSREQATANREIDRRTDTWSSGIIAFECVTGSPPPERENIGALAVPIWAEGSVESAT